jgi:hypothetical protein
VSSCNEWRSRRRPPQTNLNLFTVGLPVYRAIILSAPRMRRSLRPLILGTLAMLCIETCP